MHDWLPSYLNYRQQLVKVDHAYSEYKHASSGVPQGSVLCPLLFIIYIHNMTSTKIIEIVS